MKEFSKEEALRGYDIWGKPISKVEGFKLPEKWCVKCNTQEVVDYCNKYGKIPPYCINDSYAHFPSWDNVCTTSDNIKKDYTEITLELFKKYVLKEGEEPKSLVGRYLKALVNKPQFIECANKNEYFLIKHADSNILHITRIIDNSKCWLASKAEIGKIWELMHEGFEPPKEEFKEKWIPQVGDWIVCIEGCSTHKKGDITRVTFYGNHNGSQKLMTPELDKLYPYKSGWAYASNFRKAEPHEVSNYSEEKWEKVGEVKVKYEFHLEEEKKENKNITLWSAPIVGVEEEKEYIPLAIKKFKKLTLWQK